MDRTNKKKTFYKNLLKDIVNIHIYSYRMYLKRGGSQLVSPDLAIYIVKQIKVKMTINLVMSLGSMSIHEG